MASPKFVDFLLLLMSLYLASFVGRVHNQTPDEREIMEDLVPSIVNGEDAFSGEFPSYVGLFLQDCPHFSFCGGFLACKNVIITAEHCGAYQYSYAFPYTQKDNRFNFTSERESFNHTGKFQGIAIQVKEVFVHPLFNLSSISYDVAVMILECDVPESKYVKYSSYCEWGVPTDYGLLSVGGFGRTTSNTSLPMPTHMQRATLQKLPNDECVKLDKDGWSEIGFPNRSDAYCVYKPKGQNDSICFGDSGSGIYQSMNGKRTAVGVGSFSFDCDPEYGDGITNICRPELKEFIDHHVNKYCSDKPNRCTAHHKPANPCPLDYYEE